MKLKCTVFMIALSVVFTACGDNHSPSSPKNTATTAPTLENINSKHIANAADTPEVWLSYGGTYDEQRFSRLKNINQGNVKDLGVAWTYDLETSRGVEATPIVVDGVMYVTGSHGLLFTHWTPRQAKSFGFIIQRFLAKTQPKAAAMWSIEASRWLKAKLLSVFLMAASKL